MIITLCGSARFEPYFKVWNEVLTLAGHVVFSLSVYPSDKQGVKTWYSQAEKEILDKAHFLKIDASDAILVINRYGYIGASTLNEVSYAMMNGKTVYALESWGQGLGIECASPIDTTSRSGIRYAYDLLGPGGPFRSGLVERINEVKEREVHTVSVSKAPL